MGVLSYNALAATNLDNGVDVNPVDLLSTITNEDLDPTQDTYAVMARAYAVKGNASGVV